MFNKNKSVVYEVPCPPKVEMREIEKSFACVFASEDGKRVLSHLQAVTFCRALGAESSDQSLRYAEGQPALVAAILRLIDRGRAG